MAIFELILLKVSTLFFSKKSFDMQQTTNGVTRQLSNSTSSQTDGNQAQQNRNNATGTAGNWRCEVFVDTPITRELIQGPLNIHLPPIQLPAGLTNFMGQFAQNNSAQLQRQTSTTSSTSHDNGIIPATPNGQLPTINQGAIGEERSTHQNSGGQPQNPASPVSPTISWSRASSTPAVMNSSGSSTGESFVIDMDEDPMTPGSTNRIHRRRSSSPIRTGSGSIRHANPSSSAIVATNSSPSEPQLTQRTTSTASGNATLNQTFDGSTSTNGEGNGNAEEGGGTTDDDATMRNLRMRLHELIRRRHQIMRTLVEHSGEFPSLYLMGVLLSSLLVLFFVIIQFFAVEFTACLALIFAIFHYSDVVAFKRYISGTGSAWLIGGKIALRQFMILSVLGQSIYVLPPVIFRETAISTMQNPTFWSTLYIVFLTDFFIMDCMLGAKLFVANLPKCSLVYKRRLYQWLEYTAAIYRFAIPFVQWNAYLGALWWTVIYGGVKILLGLAMAWGWLLTTLRIFRSTHLGTSPTEAERKQHEQCTICFGEFVAPIKLKCSHIFCSECIRTWLDREHTCPICRAIVTKEDNNYRNGESMTPALF